MDYTNQESFQIPTIEKIDKPLSEVVTAVLKYVDQDTERNPFIVQPNITGQTGGEWIDVSLDDPKSLKLKGYVISYLCGRSTEEYQTQYMEEMRAEGIGIVEELLAPMADAEKIVTITMQPETPKITDISWDHDSWKRNPQSRPGYKKLEQLLQNL